MVILNINDKSTYKKGFLTYILIIWNEKFHENFLGALPGNIFTFKQAKWFKQFYFLSILLTMTYIFSLKNVP